MEYFARQGRSGCDGAKTRRRRKAKVKTSIDLDHNILERIKGSLVDSNCIEIKLKVGKWKLLRAFIFSFPLM